MPRRKTKEEFIADAILKHGGEFDYSNVIYIGNKNKVVIICSIHGEFLLRPNDHLNGIKCKKCSGNYSLTSEEFILESKKLYGEKFKYITTNYVNSKTNITIECPNHGKITINPRLHLTNGNGCNKCTKEIMGKSRQTTKSEFINRSKKVHKNKYSYTEVQYNKAGEKVKITCLKHGIFEQTPESHMAGHGCPSCGYDLVSIKTRTGGKQFIERCQTKHNYKYNYENTNYTTGTHKISIVCPRHGAFKQIAANHLSGSGCPKCKAEKHRVEKCLTTEEFITRAKIIHGNRYDYSNTIYKTSREKVTIICREHGLFQQSAGLHMTGSNCTKCTGQFMNTDYFIEKALKVHKGIYDYSKVKYLGNDKYVEIVCKEHGVFTQTPHCHLRGGGCPVCASSLGELKIYNLLTLKNIEFKPQKHFKGCVYKNTLPFDFYIPPLELLIEFHGRQHYEYIEHFHKNIKGFEKRKLKDKIKKNYAEANHKFLCIPYWDFQNIEEILENELKALDTASTL